MIKNEHEESLEWRGRDGGGGGKFTVPGYSNECLRPYTLGICELIIKRI